MGLEEGSNYPTSSWRESSSVKMLIRKSKNEDLHVPGGQYKQSKCKKK